MPSRTLLAVLVGALLVLGIAVATFGPWDDEDPVAKETAEELREAVDGTGPSGPTGEQPSLPEVSNEVSKIRSKVQYLVTSKKSGKTTTSQLTIAQDPPKRAIRFDETTSIVTGDGDAILCTSNSACDRIEGAGGFADTAIKFIAGALLSAIDSKDDPSKLPSYKDAGTKTIAGLEARCFTYTKSGTWTQCVSVDAGLILKLEVATETETTRYEATEVARPEAKDFEPPSPAK